MQENERILRDRYEPEIIRFDVDWMAIKEACLTTVGKQSEKMPTNEWKKKILMAEHSPIRRSLITVRWEKIPYYISTHFSRHSVGVTPYIQTSREDRTGVPREERKQTDFVSMEMDMNIQALKNILSKRLCLCSDPETMKYARGLLEAINSFDKTIAWACVPQCIRNGGCPEAFSNCHYYDNFSKYLEPEEQKCLIKRYDKYNKFRGF